MPPITTPTTPPAKPAATQTATFHSVEEFRAAQPARVEPLYCPICGNIRKRPTDIVCGDCYRIYVDETAIGLAEGQLIGNVFEWVVGKAQTTMTRIEGELVTTKAEVETLGKRVAAETFATLKQNAGGQQVPDEVWKKAFRTKKDELWRANGGNAKFARMKGLESRIALLRSILEKAKEEPKPAPPAAPPTPVPQPVTPLAATPAAVTQEAPLPAPAKAKPATRTTRTRTKKEA